MLFTAAEATAIRRGKRTAVLRLIGENFIEGRVTPMRRRDEGATQVVYDQKPDGDRQPVMVTIERVRQVIVSDLSYHEARICGHRTSDGLRDEWRDAHPRSKVAKLVAISIGDRRDVSLFLTSTRAIREGSVGDYTFNPTQASDDLEVLRPAEVERLVRLSHQKGHAAHRSASERLRARSLAERAAILEKGGDDVRAAASKELRAIEQRVARAERRIAV